MKRCAGEDVVRGAAGVCSISSGRTLSSRGARSAEGHGTGCCIGLGRAPGTLRARGGSFGVWVGDRGVGGGSDAPRLGNGGSDAARLGGGVAEGAGGTEGGGGDWLSRLGGSGDAIRSEGV
jgi:hypothetical protein